MTAGHLGGGERAATRRRWAATGLVAVAILLGLGTGIGGDAQPGLWVAAGSTALASAIVALGAPRRSRSSSVWRLLAHGMAIFSAGLALFTFSWGDDVAGAPLPNAADAPQLVGLAIIAGAVLMMAVARSERVDAVGRLDELLAASEEMRRLWTGEADR
jgi:hypothetical protein